MEYINRERLKEAFHCRMRQRRKIMDKEYIDRKALQEMLNAKSEMAQGTPKQVFCAVAKMVELLPAADVVPVLRCKDCKHYSDFDPHNCKRLKFHFCNKFVNITRESDFCSYGERKNNGTTQT